MPYTIDYYINQLHNIALDFEMNRGISDIFTNSKIYEVVISEQLDHHIINGHAHTFDAEDSDGHIFEYKHFKLSSSNHTWTFNDFSSLTINHLRQIDYVIFAIIDDFQEVPVMTQYYSVPAIDVSDYLIENTPSIRNTRSMINISPHQIEHILFQSPVYVDAFYNSALLRRTFHIASELTRLTGVDNILTSNKLWELLVSIELGHSINPEQKKHDATDIHGNTYEYKVSAKRSWSFQDISDNVLSGYLDDTSIILATVDKKTFSVLHIYECSPQAIVSILKDKLEYSYSHKAHITRRFESIGVRDLNNLLSSGNARIVI